jgi:hypothetical protein
VPDFGDGKDFLYMDPKAASNGGRWYMAVPAADTFYLTGPGYTSKASEKPATM